MPELTLTCAWCGEDFHTEYAHQRYCGRRCRSAADRRRAKESGRSQHPARDAARAARRAARIRAVADVLAAWTPSVVLMLPAPVHCAVEGCERTPRTRSDPYCGMHRHRLIRHGNLGPAHAIGTRTGGFDLRTRTFARVPADDYVAALLNDPCAYCGQGAEHRDHIDARAHVGGRTGGRYAALTEVDNLTAACETCNRDKGTSTLLTFLIERRQGASDRIEPDD